MLKPKTIKKQKTLIFLLSAMLFIALAFIVYSWTEPIEMPSSYSIPLNTSTVSQIKPGSLHVTEIFDFDDSDYYINPSGDSAVKGRISMADPLGNNHGATKGYVDGLFGNVVEQEISSSNLIYVAGINLECPSNSIMILREWLPKTCSGNGQVCGSMPQTCTTKLNWGSIYDPPICSYCYSYNNLQDCIADSWDGILCAKINEALLHGDRHTEEHCQTWNGEVVLVEGDVKICKFNSETCPGAWTQYENWSTTVPSPSAFYKDPIERTSYYTGSHEWSNTPVESFVCRRCPGGASWKGYYFCGTGSSGTCPMDPYYSYATITQIGCY